MIDDVISDGASKIEHIKPLESEGLKVKDIVVLLDRGQGGPDIMKEKGYKCHCISGIEEMLKVLRRHKKIDDEMVKKAREFMAAARTP